MTNFTDSAQSKQIDQHEHSIDASAKKVILKQQDLADGNWYNLSDVIDERYDYSSPTTIYTATAQIGTSDASTGWTIIKYDLSNSSNATGKVAVDVSWNDRATGTYL